MGTLYTAHNMPPFASGTANLLAQPRPDTTFACVWAEQRARVNLVQADTHLARPHVHTEQRELRLLGEHDASPPHVHIEKGEAHILVSLDGEHMVAPDALLGNDNPTYGVVVDDLPWDDARAAYMRGLWAQHGARPQVMAIQRITPLRIVGQVPDTPDTNGRRFKGSPIHYYTLEPGSYIVRTHNSGYGVVTERVMRRLADRLTLPGEDGATVLSLSLPE